MDVFVVDGIKSVEFSFIAVNNSDNTNSAANLTLWYDFETKQVALSTADPAVFSNLLLDSPILFLMTVTDESVSCGHLVNASITNGGCSSSFVISLQTLEMNDCPSDIAVTVPVSSTFSPPIVWQEPNLVAAFPFLSNFQPGDVFPLGTTSVEYKLYETAQSQVQSHASRITCQFNVC